LRVRGVAGSGREQLAARRIGKRRTGLHRQSDRKSAASGGGEGAVVDRLVEREGPEDDRDVEMEGKVSTSVARGRKPAPGKLIGINGAKSA
jgi:hypothetical protein